MLTQVYVCAPHACRNPPDSEEVSDLLELTKLEFQEIVRDYMGAKNPIHVIC